jgi:hypothetical protein
MAKTKKKATAVVKTATALKTKASKKLPGLDGGQLPKKKFAVKLHGGVVQDLSKSKATAISITAAKKAASIADHSKGLEHLLATMEKNLTSAEFQEEACGRLYNMAMDDDVGCEAVVAAGGIERILAAMAKHKKVEVVLFQAVAALDVLADSHENQAKIVQVGGVESVLAAMAATFDKVSLLNRDLQGCASSVLIKIAFNVKPRYEEKVYLDAMAAILDGCKTLKKVGKTCELQLHLHPERTSKAHLKEHVMAAISARFASSKMPMSADVKNYKLSLKKTASDLKNDPTDPVAFFICCECHQMIQKDKKNQGDLNDCGERDVKGDSGPYCNQCLSR